MILQRAAAVLLTSAALILSACSQHQASNGLLPKTSQPGQPRHGMSTGTSIVQIASGAKYSMVSQWTTAPFTNAPTVGNVMVLAMAWESSANSLSTPNGWTKMGMETYDPTYYNSIAIFCKVVQSGDTGSAAFSTSPSTTTSTYITYEISGENQSTPCDAFGSARTDSEGPLLVPSGTPSGSAFPIAFFSSRITSSSSGLAPGWTEDKTQTGGPYVEAQHGQITTSPATAQLTFGAPGYQVGVIVMVEPEIAATIPQTHVQDIVAPIHTSAPGATNTASSPGPWKQYASFAWDTLYSLTPAYNQAGIPLIYYDNPMMPVGCFGASPSTDCANLNNGGTYNDVAAKDCSGNLSLSYSGTGLAADPTKTDFANYWDADLTAAWNHISGYGATYALLFVDNNSGYGLSPAPCGFSLSAWGDGFSAGVGGLGTLPGGFAGDHIVTNTFSGSDANQSTLIDHYLAASGTYGGMYEGCFTAAGGGYGWGSVEDSQILAVAYLKAHSKPQDEVGWWCYGDGTSTAGSTLIQGRMYTYASFLLTYDLHYSSYQTAFASSPSNISLFPETEFVPLGPTLAPSSPITSSPLCTTYPTSCGTATTPGGPYVEYFNNGCYYAGAKVSNSCEVAVNPTGTTDWSDGAVSGGSPQTISNPNGYAHQLTCTGGGTLDGGTCSFTQASTTTLQPQTGEILVP